ncbi:alkaline phosphatase family protein [Chitinophaga arvensicola]|uniref:Chitobiase/beta-hexosaminidase C-terminal domain-containing protein n=1 Tax=Chitinophaga arvensicola TaxID=29529 RepID=A0A1I0QXY2_9BACT|nr:alkaline phosphatase family protein [Chitinophaga arvensicola]SEW32455.1 Chitobiase/beta-hexosaminidase C-terminal domain-containing protein [Chitinophaga arvensicola]
MRKTIVTGCLALLTGVAVTAQVKERYPEGIAHVVVIGIDGLSPDGIRKANTPVMHRMIDSGAVKWNVRTVLPSSSSPNWASMIMGAGVEQHGVQDNDWEKGESSLPAVTTGEEGLFPTIFGVVRQARPTAEIGAVYHWDGFGRLFEKKAVNYDHHFETEGASTDSFATYLVNRKPLFAFLHMDHVDAAGHEYGHGTAAYFQAVSRADSLIGQVLTAIRQAGMEKNTLVIVTADHGGVGTGHGGATIEEAEIAMILYGKGIKKGYKIQQQMATYDLAATIAFALKIVPPYVWTGRPAKPAFTGFTEPANLWLGKSLLPAPVIYPERQLYEQAGGLFVDQTPTVKMLPVAEKSSIRYTLDGSEPGISATLYQQPFNLAQTTVVKARSFDEKGNESTTSSAYFRVLHAAQGHGLQVQYYPGSNWKYLPVFSRLKSTQQWESLEFHLDKNKILPLLDKDHSTFGIVFKGYIEITTPGKYVFYTRSDDGSQLFINDEEVVTNDGDHGVIERGGTIELTKGRHPVRLEYFNSNGGFWLETWYKGPGITKQIVPADILFLNKD